MSINMPNLSEWEPWMIILCVVLLVWDLARKAVALYRAWQKSDKIRFMFIFILNTCGILPIIYLIQRRKKKY